MISKMVTDRQKHADYLADALEKHAAQATSRFSDLVRPHLQEGEEIPDLVFFQELLQRHLAAVRRDLVAVDDLHHMEQKNDKEAREARDLAVSDLASLLARLRLTVKGVCGSDTCGRVLDLDGAVPRDPVVLQRYSRRVVERLESGSLAEQLSDKKSSILGGVSIDATSWVRFIEEPLGRLEQALKQLSREGRDTIESQLAKNTQMANYDRAYRSTARILENVCRFVGMDELAQKVRPPSHRRSSSEASEDGGSGTGDSDAGDSDDGISGSRESPEEAPPPLQSLFHDDLKPERFGQDPKPDALH